MSDKDTNDSSDTTPKKRRRGRPSGTKGIPRRKKPVKLSSLVNQTVTADEARELKTIADAEQKIYQAKLFELKVAEARKELVKLETVNNILITVFSLLKNRLYAASSKLPAEIVGREHSEVQAALFRYVDNTLQQCAEDFEKEISKISSNEDEQ